MALSDHGQYSGVVDIARNGIDEVIRLKAQAKQDDALILQLVEALDDLTGAGDEAWGEERPCVRIGKKAITAARARLGEKP